MSRLIASIGYPFPPGFMVPGYGALLRCPRFPASGHACSLPHQNLIVWKQGSLAAYRRALQIAFIPDRHVTQAPAHGRPPGSHAVALFCFAVKILTVIQIMAEAQEPRICHKIEPCVFLYSFPCLPSGTEILQQALSFKYKTALHGLPRNTYRPELVRRF